MTIRMPRSINAAHIFWMMIVLQIVVFIFILTASPVSPALKSTEPELINPGPLVPALGCQEDMECWDPCTMGNHEPCP